jgi:hypothetical protein
MDKKRIIKEMSNDMIKEKLKEWLSLEDIILYFKSLDPKNKIEKRIIQRSVCIIGWNLCIKQGKFKNKNLEHLLSILRK